MLMPAAVCSPVQINYWLDSVATLRIDYQVLSLVSAQQIEPGLLSSQSINNLPFKPALSMKSASAVLHLHVQDVAAELRCKMHNCIKSWIHSEQLTEEF